MAQKTVLAQSFQMSYRKSTGLKSDEQMCILLAITLQVAFNFCALEAWVFKYNGQIFPMNIHRGDMTVGTQKCLENG